MTLGQAVGAWLDELLGTDGSLVVAATVVMSLLMWALWVGLRLWWRWCDVQEARRRREWARERAAERARRFVMLRIRGVTGGPN